MWIFEAEAHVNNAIKILFRREKIKETQHFTITRINWLILFKDIIAVYTENYAKIINTLRGLNAELPTVKASDGVYRYHWALKG
jgi:hypothetical protein